MCAASRGGRGVEPRRAVRRDPCRTARRPLSAVPLGLSEMEVAPDAGRARDDGQARASSRRPRPPHSRRRSGRSRRAASSTPPTRPTRPRRARHAAAALRVPVDDDGAAAMDVSNASLYDGARDWPNGADGGPREPPQKSRRCCCRGRCTALPARGPLDRPTRASSWSSCPTTRRRAHDAGVARPHAGTDVAALYPQPNFFGVLEEVDALTDWRTRTALAIGVVNRWR